MSTQGGAPEAEVTIRAARATDSAALARLIIALGYKVVEADMQQRIAALQQAGLPPLVADLGGETIGCLTLSLMTVLHRPRLVGRISMLVVDERLRSRGIGGALVAAAEAWLRDRGCGLVEVTSNVRRTRAHAFYEGLGYERTSLRFAKAL